MKTTPFFFHSALSFLVGAFALGTTAFAQDLDGSDKSFIKDAYEDGLAEVAAGELGKAKATNPEVKAFAEQMVTEHSKANAELKALADAKKVSVAEKPSLVDQGRAKMMDMKSGADFDKAYVEAMITDHKKAVEMFQKASNEAKDAEVKAWATKTLPALQHHLQMAQGLQEKVGK